MSNFLGTGRVISALLGAYIFVVPLQFEPAPGRCERRMQDKDRETIASVS